MTSTLLPDRPDLSAPIATTVAQAHADPACPLCASHDGRLLERVRTADLDHEYRRQFGLSVLDELKDELKDEGKADGGTLAWWRCGHCQLEHYAPLRAGSSTFYAALAGLPGYYTTGRWEFAETTRRLGDNPDLIDVGCGDGEFLRGVPGQRKRGLEFNPEAVHRAVDAGLDVRQAPLETQPDASADVITMFQVIEHVTDPAGLIREAVRVLRPGGRLFLSVPNNDGYVGHALHDPMNAPPHHVLRWHAATFEALATLRPALPLRCRSVLAEPLAPALLYAHRRAAFIDTLRRVTGERLPLHRVSTSMTLLRRLANVWALASLRLAPGVRPGTQGPTLLAELQRTDGHV